MPLPRQSERWIFNPDRNHPAFELKNQVIALQREFVRVGQTSTQTTSQLHRTSSEYAQEVYKQLTQHYNRGGQAAAESFLKRCHEKLVQASEEEALATSSLTVRAG
jgi:hypothetical protein